MKYSTEYDELSGACRVRGRTTLPLTPVAAQTERRCAAAPAAQAQHEQAEKSKRECKYQKRKYRKESVETTVPGETCQDQSLAL